MAARAPRGRMHHICYGYGGVYGHLHIIRWLHENRNEGCTARAIDEATSHGHLEIVQWLLANRTEGCSDYAQAGAYYSGHLSIFQWLHNHQAERCAPQIFTTVYDYTPSQLDILEFAAHYRQYISLGLAVDILIENGRFGAAESLLRNAHKRGILVDDSHYITPM